jgi:uncharacterized protein (DUF1778 family)
MATMAKNQLKTTTIRFDDDYTRQVIDKAAELLHQTRTGFLLSVAREKAEAVIKERAGTMREIESLILSPAASLAMIKALENPPEPNRAIKKAMKEYKKTYTGHRK